MSKVRISDILKGHVSPETDVVIAGWVRTRRDSKAGFSFLNVHDGSCFDPIQVIVDAKVSNYESDVLKLSAGCAVSISGVIKPSAGKGQSVELHASECTVHGWVEDPESYPMQPKRHSMEYLRSMAHLRPRTNLIGAMTRVRHCLAKGIHDFFANDGFYWIHTPLITSSDGEGAGEMFKVSTLDLANLPRSESGQIDYSKDFFGRESFLTVTGQLNVETYCMALSKVYTFGPTFRAENSNTRRHLAEFWMVEPEIAFADLDDNIELADRFLKFILQTLLEERADDLAFFQKRVDKQCIDRIESFVKAPCQRMTYTKAIEVLKNAKHSFENPVEWGADLQSEHERYLCEQYVKGPVAVTDYPKDIKAFYMRQNDDGKTVAAVDILVPGVGEMIGGSQREERLDRLDGRLTEMGMPHEEYWWYRDLRRYGTVPHAGFGLGFERAVMYATGIENIRDVIPFPRTPRNADF
ncbi:MAG: asparagine--tRNA ligase [Bradymonadia bacterium]